VERPAESRAFVDEALRELRRSGWRPGAWGVFLRRCGARSARQVLAHPRAALEVTALHLPIILLLPRSAPRVAASWGLAVMHLGLLGGERSIGPATVLSLVRGNLPAGRLTPLAAAATDLADGYLARRAEPTAFGAYADSLADVAFWTRQAWSRERDPALRAVATAFWLLPLLVVAGAYLARGATLDRPRPALGGLLGCGLQGLLAARALTGGGAR
jgi:CDP-alcohol phosphatidyltransferase-like enzyme